MAKERYVILTEEEFEDLEKDSFWLEALRSAGVDNQGAIMELAHKYYKDNYGDIGNLVG